MHELLKGLENELEMGSYPVLLIGVGDKYAINNITILRLGWENKYFGNGISVSTYPIADTSCLTST